MGFGIRFQLFAIRVVLDVALVDQKAVKVS
jgi:hypothetical protein